ncbi:MAG: hypothetical protein AAGH19_10790, partial [Pseudomonadota bacterium]
MHRSSRLGLSLATALCASAASADIIINVDDAPLDASVVASYELTVNEQGVVLDLTTNDGVSIITTSDDDGDSGGDDNSGGGPAPLTLNFSATPLNVELGDPVTFSWSVSGATFCDTKWGGNDRTWKDFVPNPAGGSRAFTMNQLGETQYRMFCQNDSGETRATGVIINVTRPASTPPPTTASCPPPETNGGTVRGWGNFWGANFPNQAVQSRDVTISGTGYYAIRFNTRDNVFNGEFLTIPISSGTRYVSVSQCPGVFLGAPDGCWQFQATSQDLEFSTDGTPGCRLAPNTEYYVNVT